MPDLNFGSEDSEDSGDIVSNNSLTDVRSNQYSKAKKVSGSNKKGEGMVEYVVLFSRRKSRLELSNREIATRKSLPTVFPHSFPHGC